MSKSTPPPGAGARRAAPAVIVQRDLDDESVPLSRIGPAGVMSVVFHGVLLAAFVLLAPAGHVRGDLVDKAEAIIDVDRSEAVERPSFDVIDVNEHSREPHGNFNNGSEGRADFTIPETPFSDGPVGVPDATPDGPQVSVLPGLGASRGAGMPAALNEGVGTIIPNTQIGGSGSYSMLKKTGMIGRSGATKERLLNMSEGTAASEAVVAKGLRWLARVQSPDGLWRLDGNFPDKGTANDVAGTALGLLPFLGAGKTHKASKDNNVYDKAIDKALNALLSLQDKRTGAFSRDMYAHGLATIAITEAFGLSQDYSLKKPAQLAINFILKAQHEGGGWRYSPGQAGDTSVSGWQIMALKSGLLAGLDVPPVALRKAQTFLDSVVAPSTEGSGYTDPNPTPTMTAVALLCRQYLSGWGRQNLRLIKAVDNHIKPNSPRPERKDVYYYYYATQVMHNLGGDDWKAWNVKMRDMLIASQDDDPNQPTKWGSWSPAGDQWGRNGGRLMVTSLNLLTLEVYYRYLPLYYREP